MSVPQVRLAHPGDAGRIVELVFSAFGGDYPTKEVYDASWMALQLETASGQETWVAEVDGLINASVTFLKPAQPPNPVLNLGRNLFRPESYSDGTAKALLQAINEMAMERGQIVVARVPAHDNKQQILFENLNYSCVGFQPFKHMLPNRTSTLFYVREANQVLLSRLPLSESLPQISELAAMTFNRLKISNPMTVRDGAVGYPIQTDLKVHEASYEDYKLWRDHCQSANPPVEISAGYNLGLGMFRIEAPMSFQTVLGQVESQIVAGIAYYFDEHDRCVRIVDGFSTDDVSMGTLLQQVTRIAQDQFSAVYVEVDALATAPRFLKTTEQLGFIPVTYLPAFSSQHGAHADVVKMVKLNMPYALENLDLTAHARSVVEIIDRNFQDQKIGVAIINLLRTLPIFEGLGDGELRKIARLFSQKLFRAGEQIFKKGDSGESAYVVMRGQVDIQLEENTKPIATVQAGKVFGELAFLDGAPRNAHAIAVQPSIVLLIHRNAFNELVQREPHLGMVIMRNIAIDLSNKLRLSNTTIASLRQAVKS